MRIRILLRQAERQFGPCLVYLVYLVYLVCSVYLVCPVLVWFNQTHEIDQIDQRNQTDQMLVVDFSTGWWIATMSACVSSRQDTSLLGNLGHCRMAMLARALRFRYDKHK